MTGVQTCALPILLILLFFRFSSFVNGFFLSFLPQKDLVSPLRNVSEYVDRSIYVFSGDYKYRIVVDKTTVSGVAVGSLPVNLYIESEIELKRHQNFNSSSKTAIVLNPAQIYNISMMN